MSVLASTWVSFAGQGLPSQHLPLLSFTILFLPLPCLAGPTTHRRKKSIATSPYGLPSSLLGPQYGNLSELSHPPADSPRTGISPLSTPPVPGQGPSIKCVFNLCGCKDSHHHFTWRLDAPCVVCLEHSYSGMVKAQNWDTQIKWPSWGMLKAKLQTRVLSLPDAASTCSTLACVLTFSSHSTFLPLKWFKGAPSPWDDTIWNSAIHIQLLLYLWLNIWMIFSNVVSRDNDCTGDNF